MRDDKNWLNRNSYIMAKSILEPEVSYEPLDIMKMEMPPAFRIWTKGMIIEHDDSKKTSSS